MLKKNIKAQLLFQLSEHSKNRTTLLCPFLLLWLIFHNVCTDCRIADKSGCFVVVVVFFYPSIYLWYILFLQTLNREFNHLAFILELFVPDQKDETKNKNKKTPLNFKKNTDSACNGSETVV